MKPNAPNLITRREAILRVSAMLGGVALVGQGAMLAGCEDKSATPAEPRAGNGLFAADEVDLLDEIADTILPETGTPGAKAAGVGPFMALMVTDTYSEAEQQIFQDGLKTVDRLCRDTHGADFMSAMPAQRLALLEQLDSEQMHYMSTYVEGTPMPYFRMLKELALLGYFTSEIGCNEALRYAETPGRYDPCVPYHDGEKAIAPHA